MNIENMTDQEKSVMLFTFTEMFLMHADIKAGRTEEERQEIFLRYMEKYDIEPIGSFDISITQGGFNEAPPKRVMDVNEYKHYWLQCR